MSNSSAKTLVITGASRGIGAELAREAVARGWNAVLVGRTQSDLENTAKLCNADNQTLVVVADVTKRADVDQIIPAAANKFGSIDVWINNAGQGITKPTEQLTDDDFDLMMSINCKSALYGMQAAMKHFRSKSTPTGQIINVSSMLGRVPLASFRSAYSAAKHALNSLTATLRMDIADEGLENVHICTFHPGVVFTEFGLRAANGGVDNRLLPDCQPVEEVAAVILGMVEHPRPDVYSRDAYKQDVINYYASDDIAAYEKRKRAEYKAKFLAAMATRAGDASAAANKDDEKSNDG